MVKVKKVTSKKSSIVNRKSNIVKSKKSKRQPITDKRQTGLSIPVYSLTGRSAGTLKLPKEIFGQKVNKKLLAQAVRVYMTNQKQFTASTKTRGEVRGSTAKIFRQKGTGRARHGAIRAPIFIGGGIVFGPKPRKIRLDLPKKMKRAALVSALSDKMAEKKIAAVSGLEKATGKTKQIAQLLKKLKQTSSTLMLVDGKLDKVVRATRNIPQVNVLPVNMINAYEVLKHDLVMITKEAVSKLNQRPTK